MSYLVERSDYCDLEEASFLFGSLLNSSVKVDILIINSFV